MPHLPATEVVLSKHNVITKITNHERFVVEAVYEYWLAKRRAAGGPLLQHLWFEQPWKVGGWMNGLGVSGWVACWMNSHVVGGQWVGSWSRRHKHQSGSGGGAWCTASTARLL